MENSRQVFGSQFMAKQKSIKFHLNHQTHTSEANVPYDDASPNAI